MNIASAVVAASIIAAAVLSTLLVFHFSVTAGIIQLVVFATVTTLFVIRYLSRSGYYREVIQKASRYFDTDGGLQRYPMPVVVVGKKGEIVWYNERFQKEVLPGDHYIMKNHNISDIIGDYSCKSLVDLPGGLDIEYGNRFYTVYTGSINAETDSYCLFFYDNTDIKVDAEEYHLSKPACIYIKMDNVEGLYEHFRNSDCEVIGGGIETILETWASGYPCIMKKIGGWSYFVVMEERGLLKLMDDRFDLLKSVREYKYKDTETGLTASIGAGRGNSMAESDENARQALEMSRSRGGDQAAVNSEGTFEFFGGTVGGTTSSSKVKARIMASGLSEYMLASDIVFAMGHTFSDLDSIGAAVGIYEMAKALGKPCHILVNRKRSMARSLIDILDKAHGDDIFLNEEEAKELLNHRKSLLVVVDTHMKRSLDYPSMVDRVDRVAVIDHHRRTADYIRDTVLFYNEPNSSSASEMVTELLQYIPDVKLHEKSADALLSGIMLDTRNFVLGTGVRTFEAAAYLKSKGADTVTVKQLFAGSMESYKAKSQILKDAYIYKGCAIAVTNVHCDNMRIVASQVADELTSVVGVKSSYVIFYDDGRVNISARSLGEMNVQVIMEELGGGGHFTMAATQLENVTLPEAVDALKQAITDYLEME